MGDNLNIEVILKYKVENDTYTSRLTGQHITRCSVIEGRSERYGHVEVEIRKDIFDKNIEGVWDEDNPKPIFTLGKTLVSVSGFDEVNDYILTSVVYEDYVIKITAYHPGHKINNVDLSDLLDGLFTFEGNTTAKLAYSWYMGGVLKSYTSEPVTVWAKFKSVLDNNESLYLPSDAFRALGLYGGGESIYLQGTYPGDVYKARITPPSPPMEIYNRDLIRSLLKTTGDLSWFSSGVGFKGYRMPWSKYTTDGGETYSIPSTNKFLYVYRKDDYEVIFHLSTTEQRETEGGAITTSVEIEWIEGSADDLVRFILDMTIGDDSYPQIFSEPTRLISDDTTVKDTYTEEEILELRNATLIPMDVYYDKRGYPIGLAHYNKRYTSRLRIRPQGLCTDWLEIIGIYTNRSFFFGNDGFYMMGDKGISDPNVIILNKISKDGTTITKVEESYDVISKVILASDIQKVPSADIQYVDKHAQTPEIEQYTSDNLVISQGVQSENYKFTTRNEEYTASGKERDLEFNIVDMDQVEYRNRTVNLCALHGLIRKSGYGYNISYTLFETSNIIPTVFPPRGIYFTSLEDLISTGTHPAGSTAIVDTGFNITHYKRVKNAWEAYTPALPERKKYEPKDIVGAVSDEINGVAILRSPLGYIIREYPTGLTNVSWGNNPTTNLASTTKSLMDGYSTTQPIGSGDTQISNKTSSRIVIGNMSASDVAQVGLENTLYTGLIMEKESESNTYQLVGFDRGVEQAKFNTEGKIEAGAGTVLLDHNGLSMKGDGVYLSGEGLFIEDDKVVIDRNGFSMEGDGIKLSSDGLSMEGDDILLNREGLFLGKKTGATDTWYVNLDKDGISIDDGTVKINQDGFLMEGDGIHINKEGLFIDSTGVSLTHRGLRLEDPTHGLVTLDHYGMNLYSIDDNENKHLQLTINGKGVFDENNRFLINEDGVSIKDAYRDEPFLKINEDGFSLDAEREGLEESLFRVKGEIELSDKVIDGGGVELSKDGLILDNVHGKLILANTLDTQGLVAVDDNNDTQLSLTGEGLSLPGDETTFESMKLDNRGITFKKGKDNTKDTSLIQMSADKLIFSKYMELAGGNDYYEQVTLDGDGLSVRNKSVVLDMHGLTFDQGGIVFNDRGMFAEGIHISDEGLILSEGETKIASFTKNGLSFVDKTIENGNVMYDPMITMDSRGLTAGNLLVDKYGLHTSQGGVNIGAAGIDTIRGDSGIRIDQDGITLLSDQVTDNSTLKFKTSTDVIMGKVSSELRSMPVPDSKSTNTTGTSTKTTYVTTVDGMASDMGDSTLVLRSTSGELIGNTVHRSPRMSNAGNYIYMSLNGRVKLAEAHKITSLTRHTNVSLGLDSSRFPLGICESTSPSKLLVEVTIDQPCTEWNWGFIRYHSVTVNIGGVSWTQNLNNATPNASTRKVVMPDKILYGDIIGGNVSASMSYGTSMPDFMWALYEHCRPSVRVTKIEFVGGITIKQGISLPSPYNSATYNNAYWCGPFVNLSHTYLNTVQNMTPRSVQFQLYRGTTMVSSSMLSLPGSGTNQGKLTINPNSYANIDRTGLYHARYKLPIDNTYTSDRTLLSIDAEYESDTTDGGHVYLRPDGTYLRGNTEIRAGDQAKMSIRGGGGGWGAAGIDFHNSNIDGSPVLSENFMKSIRNNLPTNLYVSDIKVSGYTTDTWYKNNTAHPMIIMFTNGSTFGNITLQNESGVNISGGKVVEGAVQGQGSGWNSYTAICPPGWSFWFGGDGTKRYFTCLLRI